MSGNDPQSKYRKFLMIAASALAVVVLILLFTGKLDGFFDDVGISEEYSGDERGEQSDFLGDPDTPPSGGSVEAQLRFRSQDLLEQHYQKHGIEMGFSSAEEYEKAAAAVPKNPAVLHKIEAEDGDDVYYVESTNEFVIVSTDGFIRTYFNPDRGIDYFNRQ